MSDDYQRIEVITGTTRRRRWSTEEKLRIVEEALQPGESISAVARRNGVAPNLLYRWRRLMTEGGAIAVQADDGVPCMTVPAVTGVCLRQAAHSQVCALVFSAQPLAPPQPGQMKPFGQRRADR